MAASSNTVRPGDSPSKTDANLKKEERAKDGAKAMMEYLADGKIVRERMANLKALRLAKEAAELRSDKEAAKKKRKV